MANFDTDYNLLKNKKNNIFILSNQLGDEILKSGLDNYAKLYPYFWSLINHNCQSCQSSSCYNRDFLIKLKKKNLNEDQLYLLVYMTTYFLDLLSNLGYSLSQSYYLLSRGHDYVIKLLTQKSHKKINFAGIDTEAYMGYLLSVLYYLLPDFKYTLKSPLN